MTSNTGMYEVWEVAIDGRPLFCLDRRFTIWDANERLRELLETGHYGGRLEIAFPKERIGGG